MRYLLFTFLMMLSVNINAQKWSEVYADTNSYFINTLEGVWHAKHLAYPFPQDGSAKIFTKKSIPNCTQTLVIDSLGNYSFILKGTTFIDTVYGKVSIFEGTLVFESSLKENEPIHERYKLFMMTSDQLIYSNKRISSQGARELNTETFSPVETGSRFKFGQDSLLSLIYREFSSVDQDSAYLNIYNIVVDEAGVARPATLNRVKGDQDFTSPLKSIIQKHYKEFIPATQNGRAVSSQLTVIFTL